MQDFWDLPHRHFGGRRHRRRARRLGRSFVRQVVRQFVRQFVRYVVQRVMYRVMYRTVQHEYDYRTNPGAALRWLVENGHVQYANSSVPQIERAHVPMRRPS